MNTIKSYNYVEVITECPCCKEYFIPQYHNQKYCSQKCRIYHYRKKGLIKKWRNNYYRALIERLYECFGCQCYICQKTKRLHFAHIEHTPILDKFPNGSRSLDKYHDIDNNKNSYRLLCLRHHRDYDNSGLSWRRYKDLVFKG